MPKAPIFDDCERPACDDVKSMFSKALKVANSGRAATATAADETTLPKPKVGEKTGIECPPNRPTIGRGSWTLFHSMVSSIFE